MGRWILFAGLGIVALGLITMALERFGLRLGRLPGDIAIENKGLSVYVPVTTMVLLSLLLTAATWIIGWLRK